jgi:hypothetical protein
MFRAAKSDRQFVTSHALSSQLQRYRRTRAVDRITAELLTGECWGVKTEKRFHRFTRAERSCRRYGERKASENAQTRRQPNSPSSSMSARSASWTPLPMSRR